MDISQLKQKIVNGSFPHKLIFVGEECYLQKQFIQLIAKSINGEFHYYNEFNDIEQDIKSNSFFDEPQVYVIFNSNIMLKNVKKFMELKVPDNKVLILIYNEYEPKKEFFKETKEFLYEFNKMGENQLKKIIERVLSLNNDNSSIFCELVNNDCSRLMLELKKLMVLKTSYNFSNDDELFNYAINNEIIYKENKENIFTLSQYLLDKRYKEAFELNNRFEKESNDIFKLINNLYDDIKRKWIKTNENKYKDILMFLQELDNNIKIGKIENEFAFNYLIINFCQKL